MRVGWRRGGGALTLARDPAAGPGLQKERNVPCGFVPPPSPWRAPAAEGPRGLLIASLRKPHPRRGGILPELLGHLRRDRRADVRDRVLRELFHGLLDVDPVDAGRVESEDQLLVLVGDGLVAVALLDVFRDLEPPE